MVCFQPKESQNFTQFHSFFIKNSSKTFSRKFTWFIRFDGVSRINWIIVIQWFWNVVWLLFFMKDRTSFRNLKSDKDCISFWAETNRFKNVTFSVNLIRVMSLKWNKYKSLFVFRSTSLFDSSKCKIKILIRAFQTENKWVNSIVADSTSRVTELPSQKLK